MLKIPARSKTFVFSTVLAVVLATASVTSAFAASATTTDGTSRSLSVVWGSQFRDLQSDRVFYNNFKSHREEINRSASAAEIQQYLSRYAFALQQAESIVLHGTPGSTLTVKINSRFERSRTAQQDLAAFLHMMRGLREKLEADS